MTAPVRLPSASAIADVLALRGGDGWLSPPLHPRVPAAIAVRGTALTIELEHRASGADFSPMYDVLSATMEGRILVVAGANGIHGAVWGEILSIAALRSGAVGVLVDGMVRDLPAVASLGLPLYSTSTGVVGPYGTAHVVQVGGRVDIDGIVVDDGDEIVLDASGGVRISAAEADEILDGALAYEDGEAELVAALQRGEPLSSAYRYKATVVARLRR